MTPPPPAHKTWPDSAWYILVILMFVVLVSTACYCMIQQQKWFLRDEKQKEISTIVDLKTQQLVQWRKERLAEGTIIRTNTMMARNINDYIVDKKNSRFRQEFKQWLANLITVSEYSKGILFTPDGEIISSDSELKEPPAHHYFDLVAEAAKEHSLILSDFHRDSIGDPYNINLAIPIMNGNGTHSRCIAVLVFDIDPAKRLYPLIQSWPTTSSTTETLLIKREGDSVLFLNELRFRKKTSTPFKLPLTDRNRPAVKAALGQEGTCEGIDYRNETVLCATRVIPGTRWGMLAKIDIREVLEPLSKSILMVAFVGFIVIICIILGLFLWGVRRKTAMLSTLIKIEQKHNIELKESENALEQQVLERTRDLSETNELLRNEIVERKQLEHELLSVKRLKTIGQIAGGVAHEVRNPLNAILTITEALFKEKEIVSNPEFEPFVLHIRAQVNRLVHLMNDLLDLGRTIPVSSLQPLLLFDVCRETLKFWKFSDVSGNKGELLTIDTDDRQIQVLADALKLQQVFVNLLDNAKYHTSDNSTIVMQLVNDEHNIPDGMAVVQIIDRGSGIPEDKLPYIFEPFYTGRKGGTGLGLALVRHYIENMGGTVQIMNNNPPPGCTVEVRIPLYREEIK
jgi:signal transduction histidine kinase